MQTRTATAVRCLIAALLIGILADALLRVGPWGLNATLCSSAFAVCLTVFAPKGRKWLGLLTVLFGLFFVWRDAPALKAIDAFAIVSLCVTAALPEAVKRTTRATACQCISAALHSIAGAVAGLPLLLGEQLGFGAHDARAAARPHDWRHHAAGVAAGIAVAAPLLLVFGALFVSADNAFRDFVRSCFDFDWDDIFWHVFIIGAVAWVVAGYLRTLAFNARTDSTLVEFADGMRFDAVVVLIPLGLLNALFATFIAVQLRYFFGGASYVLDPSGPTFSAYARQGFFQLVVVAMLALLVLHIADWIARNSAPAARTAFRALAALLIVMVYVVMASALHRMYLYFGAYGLTHLRLYTTVFMLWLAVIIAVFAATVLRGQRDRVVFVALATALATVVLLHAINPDAIIVRANAARLEAGNTFDSEYMGYAISADGVPALVEARGRVTQSEQRAALDRAIAWWLVRHPSETPDWRTWNWSLWRAVRVARATGVDVNVIESRPTSMTFRR